MLANDAITFDVKAGEVFGLLGLSLSLTAGLLWLAPTLLAGGIALAGFGMTLGLAGRDEQLAATYANLAMMAVLFLGIVPSGDFPGPMRVVLALVPTTYMVDSLKHVLSGSVAPGPLSLDLLVSLVVAVLMLAFSDRVLRAQTR